MTTPRMLDEEEKYEYFQDFESKQNAMTGFIVDDDDAIMYDDDEEDEEYKFDDDDQEQEEDEDGDIALL